MNPLISPSRFLTVATTLAIFAQLGCSTVGSQNQANEFAKREIASMGNGVSSELARVISESHGKRDLDACIGRLKREGSASTQTSLDLMTEINGMRTAKGQGTITFDQLRKLDDSQTAIYAKQLRTNHPQTFAGAEMRTRAEPLTSRIEQREMRLKNSDSAASALSGVDAKRWEDDRAAILANLAKPDISPELVGHLLENEAKLRVLTGDKALVSAESCSAVNGALDHVAMANLVKLSDETVALAETHQFEQKIGCTVKGWMRSSLKFSEREMGPAWNRLRMRCKIGNRLGADRLPAQCE